MNKTYRLKVFDGYRCIAVKDFAQRHYAIKHALLNESLYTVSVSEVLSYTDADKEPSETIIYKNGWKIA